MLSTPGKLPAPPAVISMPGLSSAAPSGLPPRAPAAETSALPPPRGSTPPARAGRYRPPQSARNSARRNMTPVLAPREEMSCGFFTCGPLLCRPFVCGLFVRGPFRRIPPSASRFAETRSRSGHRASHVEQDTFIVRHILRRRLPASRSSPPFTPAVFRSSPPSVPPRLARRPPPVPSRLPFLPATRAVHLPFLPATRFPRPPPADRDPTGLRHREKYRIPGPACIESPLLRSYPAERRMGSVMAPAVPAAPTVALVATSPPARARNRQGT